MEKEYPPNAVIITPTSTAEEVTPAPQEKPVEQPPEKTEEKKCKHNCGCKNKEKKSDA